MQDVRLIDRAGRLRIQEAHANIISTELWLDDVGFSFWESGEVLGTVDSGDHGIPVPIEVYEVLLAERIGFARQFVVDICATVQCLFTECSVLLGLTHDWPRV